MASKEVKNRLREPPLADSLSSPLSSDSSTDEESKYYCAVAIAIEIGHTASFLRECTPEGFTHSWTIFVRGKNSSEIEHYVEKVVFCLHESYKDPKRAVLYPPYEMTGCGSMGFTVPIDVHFKSKESPQKIRFSYELFLNEKDHPAIRNYRDEHLTFWNPTLEFKAKLIKAGGIEQVTDCDLQPLSSAMGSSSCEPEEEQNFKNCRRDSVEKNKKATL